MYNYANIWVTTYYSPLKSLLFIQCMVQLLPPTHGFVPSVHNVVLHLIQKFGENHSHSFLSTRFMSYSEKNFI